MVSGDLPDAVALAAIAMDSFAVHGDRLPADMAAFEPGSPHAGTHPLDDQRAFEFSDRADDDDDSPAQRAARVDLLAKRDELDSQVIQLIEDLQKMGDRPRDAIEGPDQHDVELAPPCIPQQLIEPRPLRLGATDLVRVLLHDLITALGGQLTQVVELRLRVLIDGTDSEVEGGALHPRRPFGFPACLST